MLDPDIPPAVVEEGEIDVGVAVVRPIGVEQTGRDRQQHGGIFTAPMDHNYRSSQQGGGGAARSRRGGAGFGPSYSPVEPEPLPHREDATSRIFAFVDDLFFLAKIQETARKLNVKVEFVKRKKI